jgi:hypothetical protein
MGTNAMGREGKTAAGRTGGTSGRTGQGGSAGRPGGMGNQGQTNAAAIGAALGSRPTETSYGAPVRYNKYGIGVALPETTTPGKPAQSWSSWKDQVDTYNKAAEKWNAGAGRSFGNLINAMSPMGLSMQAPDLNRPVTYTGGDYHLGWNPGSLAGIPGMYGSGIITGALGEKAYTALGGKNPILSGPDVPGGWDPKGASPAVPGGNPQSTPGDPQGKGDQSGMAAALIGNPVQSAPGGAPFGAQPTPPAPSPTPGMFTPKIPNHSLPKGYQSMFPNSLTEEDKKLLYAQALMGGA